MDVDIDAMMPPATSARAERDVRLPISGSLLVAFSAVAFSTAGLFTRLIPVDVWTVLFWRGIFGGLFILAFIAGKERAGPWKIATSVGRDGLLVAGCSTLATICFVSALRATTVADVTVIYATAPFIAAAIAWAWIGERPGHATLTAGVAALLGVAIMCGGAFSAGQATGDLLALGMTVLMATMMVIIRKNRHVSMLPASCLSAFGSAVVVLPLAHPMHVTAAHLGLLALFGTTQFGLGLLLLTIGSRMISAARASLLANLELPFAPLWVWLVFNELPSHATFVGGGIVCAAVLLDVLAEQRGRAQRPAELIA